MKDFIQFDYHRSFSPSMSHYWRKLFTSYEVFESDASSWGFGTDYLSKLAEKYSTIKSNLDEDPNSHFHGHRVVSLSFPIFQTIPKNYRPPSRYAKMRVKKIYYDYLFEKDSVK